ncbi:uncharacterized protein LOC130233256 [Danio aesculapii]|uniref:uncharacterized protein LOC130233256 n=1 Tax=Danio aesculapii TaxID=1142201 RepID=UPI0024C01BF4|nr:uncharacterized protein LOC130233256 [Danio aesculapii]
MKSNLSVKMLAALALVLLVSSVSEGRTVGKCELKSLLQAGLGGNPGGSGGRVGRVRRNVTPAPENVTASVPANVTASLPANVTASLPANVTASLPANVTASLPANVTASLPANVTASVPPNVTASLPANVTASRPANFTGGVTMPGNTTVPNNSTVDLGLIARIVCSVERLSKFNTERVNTIKSPGKKPGHGKPGRGKRSFHGRQKHSAGRFDGSSESSESSEEKQSLDTTLFGIFQLSNRVACDSGSGQSLNLCGIKCKALTDNDISNDIACLKTLLSSPIMNQFVIVHECRNVNPAQYFSKCA